MSVLLVEDNQRLRRRIAGALAMLGCRVVAGRPGICVLLQEPYTLDELLTALPAARQAPCGQHASL